MCKTVIAALKDKFVNGQWREMLIPWSHYRTYLVLLTDGSQASLPVCSDCQVKITPKDFKHLSRQIRYEMVRQQIIAYRDKADQSQRIIDAGKVCKTKEILRKLTI